MATTVTPRSHAARVARKLAILYGDAQCALVHDSPLELLIATILSAQCTDVRVNIVTKDLFRQYRTADDFARAPLAELEKAIKSTGFFRNKAKNIKACCGALVERHGGEVPRDLASLVVLPGVGRKTANVVLGTAFGIPSGVVVDTHVGRLSGRLGLTKATDPVKIEQDLMRDLPRGQWIDFSHRMIHHGRQVCIARRPRCEICKLADICPRIGVSESAGKAKPAGGGLKMAHRGLNTANGSAKKGSVGAKSARLGIKSAGSGTKSAAKSRRHSANSSARASVGAKKERHA